MNVNIGEMLQTFYMPLVFFACLGIGYIIKRIDFIPDKFIPAIMGILGVIFGFMAADISFATAVSGMFSGLASTGAHQVLKQLIEKRDEY